MDPDVEFIINIPPRNRIFVSGKKKKYVKDFFSFKNRLLAFIRREDSKLRKFLLETEVKVKFLEPLLRFKYSLGLINLCLCYYENSRNYLFILEMIKRINNGSKRESRTEP